MNDENDSSGVDDDRDGSSDTLFDRVCALCDDGGDILWYAHIFYLDAVSRCMIQM